MSRNAHEIISMDDFESSSESEEPLVQQNPGSSSSGKPVDIIQRQNRPKSRPKPIRYWQLEILRAYVNADLEKFKRLAKTFDMDFRFDITCDYMTLLEMALLDKKSGTEDRSEYAKVAIDENATLNLGNEKRPNRRAIHYAAMSENVEMLKYMIEKGNENNRVDINVQDYHGNTALHYLIPCVNYSEECGKCLTYLFERDSSDLHPDFELNLNLINNLGFSPLHLVSHKVYNGGLSLNHELDLLKLLVKKIEQKMKEKGLFEDKKVIDILDDIKKKRPCLDNIDLGFIKEAEDRTRNGQLYKELFECLIDPKRANEFLDLFRSSILENPWILNRSDPYKGTFLQYSCVKGYENIVKELLEAGADPHYSYTMRFRHPELNPFEEKPIILAYRENNYEILKQLMEKVQKKYSDPNSEEQFYDYGNFYHKILDLSISPGHYKCFQLVNSLIEDTERLYLVNEKDATQNTPLHKAVVKGDEKYVYELLKCGSCMKVTNVDGYSPIKYMTASMYKKY